MKKLKYILFFILIILIILFIIKYNFKVDSFTQESKFMTIIRTFCQIMCLPEQNQSQFNAIVEIPGWVDSLNIAYRNNDINNIVTIFNHPSMLNILNKNSPNCSQEKIQTTVNEISAIPGMMDKINVSIQNNDVQQFVNLVNNPSILFIFNKNIPTCRVPELITEIALQKGIKPMPTTIDNSIPSIPLYNYSLNSPNGPTCLDGKGNNVSMTPCNNSTSQQWYNENTNNEYTYLMNNYTHNCLDVTNNRLTMNNCNNSSNQKWKYPPKYNKFNNLFTPDTCLDGTDGNLIMKNCDYVSNQQWVTKLI